MVQDTLTNHYEEMGIIGNKGHSGIKEVVQAQARKDISDPSGQILKLISNDGSELERNELS